MRTYLFIIAIPGSVKQPLSTRRVAAINQERGRHLVRLRSPSRTSFRGCAVARAATTGCRLSSVRATGFALGDMGIYPEEGRQSDARDKFASTPAKGIGPAGTAPRPAHANRRYRQCTSVQTFTTVDSVEIRRPVVRRHRIRCSLKKETSCANFSTEPARPLPLPRWASEPTPVPGTTGAECADVLVHGVPEGE